MMRLPNSDCCPQGESLIHIRSMSASAILRPWNMEHLSQARLFTENRIAQYL